MTLRKIAAVTLPVFLLASLALCAPALRAQAFLAQVTANSPTTTLSTQNQSAPTPTIKQKTCVVRTSPLLDAEAALAREEYDTALDLFSRMAATAPDPSRAGVIRTLLGHDKVADADALAQKWIGEQPNNVFAIEAMAEVLFRKGELPEAYQINQKAHAIDICNPRIYLMDAAFETVTANYAMAKQHVELARRLDPVDPEIRSAWIGTLPRKKRLEEMDELLKQENLMNAKDRARMTEYLAHARDPIRSDCSLTTPVETATLPLIPMMNGPYPIPGVALEVAFNGKKKRLQMDTGASGLVLSRSAAANLGLVPQQKIDIGGVGDKGEISSTVAHVDSIRIGNLEFHNCAVEVLGKKSASLESDGLIGGNVFSKFLLTLDMPKHELRLNPLPQRPQDSKNPNPENSASLSTRPENASEGQLKQAATGGTAAATTQSPAAQGPASNDESEVKAHDRYIAPEMKNWTPVFRIHHSLLLPIRIADNKEKLFIVDTGAATMLISPNAAREVTKVNTDYNTRIGGLSGEVNKVYETGKFTLTFAHLEQHVASMTSIDTTKMSHDSGVEISGFLGDPILHRLTIHIDYRDNLMKFEYDPKN